VRLVIETPKRLTKRQEELLRELAELDHKHVSPERKSFLDRLYQWFAPEDAKPAKETKPKSDEDNEA
jgi:molecular chaperone DnaJ